MLKRIAAALGYVRLADVEAAAAAGADAVYRYAAVSHLPAWQLIAEPFRARGIDLRQPGLPATAPDMRRS